MQPSERLGACLTAQAPPQEGGVRYRGDVLRIRVALTLGAFLIAGGAFTGTALASTAAPAPAPTVTSAPAPTQMKPTDPRQVLTEKMRADAKAKADAAAPRATRPAAAPVRVPRAIPAGPTGDLHLPAITASN
jgi:hypothetical protein